MCVYMLFWPCSHCFAKPKSHSFTLPGRLPSSRVLSSFRSLHTWLISLSGRHSVRQTDRHAHNLNFCGRLLSSRVLSSFKSLQSLLVDLSDSHSVCQTVSQPRSLGSLEEKRPAGCNPNPKPFRTLHSVSVGLSVGQTMSLCLDFLPVLKDSVQLEHHAQVFGLGSRVCTFC